MIESFLHRQLYDTLCGWRLQEAVTAFEEQYSVYKSPVPSPAQGFFGGSWQRATNYLSNQVLISLLTAAAVIGLLLMVLSFMAAPTYERSRFNHACTTSTSGTGFQPVKGKLNFVARITGLHNCRWADNYLPPLRYAHLGLGRELKLDAGLVEITYYNGAKLVLEGPAEFKVEKANACRLDVGKLAAKVSKKAAGFTVETPTASIVDLGTEFGVEVGQSGTANVQVFVGQVDVDSEAGGGRRRLVAGQSVKIDTSGKVTETSGSSRQFAFAAMFSDGQWARSLSYVDVVLASRPIGYWRLDESGTAAAIDNSPNENHAAYSSVVEYGRESFSPALGTAAHFDGSVGGLAVGAADVPNVYSRLTNDFTVEAWVRRDFTKKHLGLIVTTGTPGSEGWGLGYDTRSGRVCFDFVTYGIISHQFTSFPVSEDTWVYVVVVFDRDNNVSLYLNGRHRETISSNNAAKPVKNQHSLLLGGTDVEPWEGGLDEVAIYDRALSPREIALHYAARFTTPNRPEPDDKQPIETPQNP